MGHGPMLAALGARQAGPKGTFRPRQREGYPLGKGKLDQNMSLLTPISIDGDQPVCYPD
jgi:hypothetical protein